MIPRPQTDAAARHNPGRWICTADPEECGGVFRVYGQAMACPLWAKCYWGRRNSYQWTLGRKDWGRCLSLDTDMERRRTHGNRLMALLRLFAPERCREKPKTREQKDEANRKAREARRKAREREPPPDCPPQRPLLPCGEDCGGGCPYAVCPYTDADLDALEAAARREKARRQSAEKYRRQKARMAADPAYAERFRAGNRRRSKAAYDRDPEKYREKSRNWQKKNRQSKRKDDQNDTARKRKEGP